MSRKNRKNKKKQTKKLSIFHILIAIVSIYVVVTFVKQEFILRTLSKDNKTADIELEALERDVSQLKNKIDKSDTVEYIEKIAREELDMIKPHEIIYKDKEKQNQDEF